MSRFQLHLKDRKPRLEVDISVFRSGKYQCHLSQESFRGACEIKQCHCNLPVNKANCLYLFYPGKTEFDKWDVMFALGINEKKLRQRYQLGKTQAYHAILFNNILTRLRTNNKHQHCPFCGVLKDNKTPCEDRQECFNRISFGRKFIQNSYLQYKEIRAQLNDVWLLLYNKNKMQDFVDGSIHPLELSTSNLLGVDDKMLELSNLHRPFVSERTKTL